MKIASQINFCISFHSLPATTPTIDTTNPTSPPNRTHSDIIPILTYGVAVN